MTRKKRVEIEIEIDADEKLCRKILGFIYSSIIAF